MALLEVENLQTHVRAADGIKITSVADIRL